MFEEEQMNNVQIKAILKQIFANFALYTNSMRVAKNIQRTLIKWRPINERLQFARFQGRQAKLSLIQCYAHTNDSDDDAKDDFYSALQGR